MRATVARINDTGQVIDRYSRPVALVEQLTAATNKTPAQVRASAQIYVLGPTESTDGLPMGAIIIRTSQ